MNVCHRMSFDVSFLFTNVPRDEEVKSIFGMLKRDESLHERTALVGADRISELMELCMKSTYFRISRKIILAERLEGAAMGSPVSAVVANLDMEFLECAAMGSPVSAVVANLDMEFLEGAAMGSPVSAVVANLDMEFLEELALTTAP